MPQERGAMGERLELKLVDGRTGEVKRHLVVAGGVCVDMKSNWALAIEFQKTEELLTDLLQKELVEKSK